MEGEKSAKVEEKEGQIVVLDAGMDVADMSDPRAICCRGPLSPLRW